MLPHTVNDAFGFAVRTAFVGVHLCGREIETEDLSDCEENGKGFLDGAPEVHMLKCGPCDVSFPATHARMYFDASGMEEPELLKEITIEEFDNPPEN